MRTLNPLSAFGEKMKVGVEGIIWFSSLDGQQNRLSSYSRKEVVEVKD
jgi:hypothetical protein